MKSISDAAKNIDDYLTADFKEAGILFSINTF